MIRFRLTIEWGRPEPKTEERESQADALVERADPHSPPLGFGPQHPREDKAAPVES